MPIKKHYYKFYTLHKLKNIQNKFLHITDNFKNTIEHVKKANIS